MPSLPKAEKKELVIPLIKNNVWRVPKNEKSVTQKDAEDIDVPDEDKTELSLEQQAIKEILAEAANSRNLDSKGTTKDMSIPLLMQNKVPDGYETDDKVDVSLRAEESTLEDYESVPIEEYGLAMLRGMGWNPGKPIGARCTEVAKPIEAVLRPKGLGLGADSKMAKPPPLVAKEDGDLVLRTGAYIRIEQGPHKDLYGQVEGLDDENARVIVKLALGGKTVTVSELFVSLVSKKDYQKYGKLLNKEKYDDYKRKHEAQEEEVAEKRRDERERHTSHKRSRVEKERESSKSAERRERSRSPKRKEQFWLRPQIRVRFIDRKYRNGKYYNTKLEVFVSVGEALKGYLGWNQHAASAQIVEGNVRGWQFVIVSLRGGFVRFEGADKDEGAVGAIAMFMTRSEYDRGVNTFSPEGRLFQVEYAIEAIKLGSTAIGIQTSEGVVLAVEKRVTSPLMEPTTIEKIVEIDNHIGCAVSGLMADSRTMVDRARVEAQNHWFLYNEKMQVESVALAVSNLAIQFGDSDDDGNAMSRPFGVAILFAGIDAKGPQL
ncbi:hypothetical protein HPB52_015300 [Rhipicephalus sanguineus]|uniref:G-patch domain-containing protein n=1 Tax=Rhipicephalus sanguineus TaxID=34632 RepID=A0A9D4SUK8_RHISA|nr:hypothetical protein HPB52_015300 [Rhipicephalus sanguineus]